MMRISHVWKELRPTGGTHSAHDPIIVTRAAIPAVIPRIGAFEATLHWVIPPNVSSSASTESRRKEQGDHGKPARRHGGDHRRFKRYRVYNRQGFCPAGCRG